jgi:hypothetical protein
MSSPVRVFPSCRRVATPPRWQGALRRALAEGITLRQLAGSGQWVATSGRDPGVAYETDGVACSCAAAQLGNDPVCKHRAVFWHRQGVLDLEPDPPTPAAPAVAVMKIVPCPYCGGSGRDWVTDHRGDQVAVTCPVCNGARSVEEPVGDTEVTPADTRQHDAPYDGDPPPRRLDDRACRECGGEGYVRMQTGGRLTDWVAVPCRCRAAYRIE